MSATPVRLLPFDIRVDRPAPEARAPEGPAMARPTGLSARLLCDRLVAPDDLIAVLRRQADEKSRIDAQLGHSAREHALLIEAATRTGAPLVDLARHPADPRLAAALGPTLALRDGLLPWRRVEGRTWIATARPAEFPRERPRLEALFGPVSMALSPSRAIEAALLDQHGPALAADAERRVPEAESCRSLRLGQIGAPALLLLAALGAGLWFAPVRTGVVLTAISLLSLLALTVLKVAAACVTARHPPPRPILTADPPADQLPVISILVALYDESDIAPRLVRRLSRLDYPRDRLDIILAVEASDHVTRRALLDSTLPAWMRVILVPHGSVRTKPRALNVALDHARGTIIGVYDAEDAPEPGQLSRVAAHFAAARPDVACLQGILDFYNPTTNWLSRCFTIEYATWFRLVLPGLARMGMVVPLGGTTLFFRRHALESLGGWDAHNVTEDADLGLRLARHGFRTELIGTVTEEEANCRAVPWIKQRSRWIKGYMLTWAVHHRNPLALWRQLGPWRVLGVELLFLGTLAQVLLAPLLWSFWAVPLGLPHPVADAMPSGAFGAMFVLFLASEAVSITLGIVALRRTKHRLSPLWVPTLHLYFPLAALASYKAAWEAVHRPFFWDKTRHGLHDQAH